MTDAGLAIREDAMGNIYGRLSGSDAAAGSVLTGSHCDAIPLAGMYDGTVGVVAAIEALAALKAAVRRGGGEARQEVEEGVEWQASGGRGEGKRGLPKEGVVMS
eukprot:364814-Chlamydomonas_euryale.AAC.4